jgi:hypothetical protein
MNELDLTGMLLWEAKEVLARQGIQDFKVVVTAPPRQTERAVRDDFRVLLVNHEKSPIELLVCGKI